MANTWTDWLRAYERVYRSPEPPLTPPCPHCGVRSLFLLFREKTSDGIGHAFLWCGSCSFGIHLSRVVVPEGAAFIPYGTPAGEEPPLPRYTLVHPGDSDDDEDSESEVF